MGLHAFRGSDRRREKPSFSGIGDPAETLFAEAVKPRAKRGATPASGESAQFAWLRARSAAQSALMLYGRGLRLAAHEACDHLHVKRQQLRPRISDMVKMEWLKPVDPRETRETGDGGKADVLEITHAGRSMLMLLTSSSANAR